MSFKVIGLGEALWDLLPSGPQLGGAPANFAYHAGALGAEASVITRIGNDTRGGEILDRFSSFGFSEETVQIDDEAPTGTVTIALSADGQPQFTIHEGAAWDRLAITKAACKAALEADAICFGSLAQRNDRARSTIQQLVAMTPKTALRVFDVNLRQKFYSREIIGHSLRLANVLKLNEDEMPKVAEMLGFLGNVEEKMAALAQRYDLQLVALTRGSRGSLLYSDGEYFDHPGFRAEVKDTIGAGDSFTAALVMGLLRKMDLGDINQRANEVAGYVCSQTGATPVLLDHLRAM